MTPDTQTISDAVQALIDRHGGLRPAARAVGINYAYLWRLWNGVKSNPSDAVLRKLGLVKEISYRKLPWRSKVSAVP